MALKAQLSLYLHRLVFQVSGIKGEKREREREKEVKKEVKKREIKRDMHRERERKRG